MHPNCTHDLTETETQRTSCNTIIIIITIILNIL